MQRRLDRVIIRVTAVISKNKKKITRRAAGAITAVRLLTESLSVTHD